MDRILPDKLVERVRKEAAALTLLELLVVVGILGLLATLAGAGASRAKGKARQVRCTSNLRQIAVGIQIYLGDHLHYPIERGAGFLTAGLEEWHPEIVGCPSILGHSYGINVSGSKAWTDPVNLGLLPDFSGEAVGEVRIISPANMIAAFDYVKSNLPPKRGDSLAAKETHCSTADYLFCDGSERAFSIRTDRTTRDDWRAMWNRDHEPHPEDW